MIQYRYIVLLTSISFLNVIPSLAQAQDVSAIFDQIVTDGTKGLKAKKEDTMPVPDLDDHFKKGIFKGGVKATGGVFSDLSTLKRSGPATATLKGSSATIHVAMSLGLMKVSFRNARVWLKPFSSSDALSVTVGHNTIDLQVTVTLGGACKTTLDSVRLTDFKDIKVQLKGAGKIMDPLTNAIVNHMHNKIAGALETKLKGIIGDELKKHDLCSVLNKG